jgi:hypothetical protein
LISPGAAINTARSLLVGKLAARGVKAANGFAPYANLVDSPFVGPGKAYTAAQKAKIYAQNLEVNGGVLKSDLNGEILVLLNSP